MADPNNVPQEANQLSEELESKDKETQDKAQANVANANFDKEYEIAQQNESGAGTQSSDPNPVNRESAEASTGSQSTSSKDTSSKNTSNIGSGTNSPGDSDPNDYRDMAKDVTKDAESSQS